MDGRMGYIVMYYAIIKKPGLRERNILKRAMGFIVFSI
jgi:hypothetical protein